MKFEIGKTYTARSACDHECVFRFTVVERSEKTIVITDGRDDGACRRAVNTRDGVEFCFPQGRYSMAPIITADRFEQVSA